MRPPFSPDPDPLELSVRIAFYAAYKLAKSRLAESVTGVTRKCYLASARYSCWLLSNRQRLLSLSNPCGAEAEHAIDADGLRLLEIDELCRLGFQLVIAQRFDDAQLVAAVAEGLDRGRITKSRSRS